MTVGDRKIANRIDAEIRAANMALAHYGAALELEVAAMERREAVVLQHESHAPS